MGRSKVAPEVRQRRRKRAIKRWFKLHGDERNERRRKQYAGDPAQREAARERKQKQRERAREGKDTFAPWHRPADATVQATRRLRPKVIDGTSVYSLGVLCERAHLGKAAVLRWEASGMLPAPTFVDSVGRRWYSQEWIDNVVDALAEGRRSKWTTEHLREVLARAFEPAAA